jgi:hypothetical protein
VTADVAALTERVAELEAAVEALRGYAGSVRAVNDRVEERADAAVATTESLRERVAALEADPGARSPEGTERDRVTGDRRRQERGANDRRTHGRGARTASRPHERDRNRREGGCARRGGVGEGDEAPGSRARRGDDASDGGDARSAQADDGEPVSWPPTDPREPYGEVDADDDRERPGLVARLRDAL